MTTKLDMGPVGEKKKKHKPQERTPVLVRYFTTWQTLLCLLSVTSGTIPEDLPVLFPLVPIHLTVSAAEA